MPDPRPNIQALDPYAPGEQPQGAEARRTIKLNTNESPYPPSPRAIEAMRAVAADQLRRYPSPSAADFRQAAADLHDLAADQVIATNGGDELLRLIMTAYCEPASAPEPTGRGGIGVTDPTYSLYPVLARTHGCSITVAPRGDDFALADDAADTWNAAGCAVGFIVNPHAPSGRMSDVGRLRRLARRFNGVLVVDEAYVDFAPHDALGLVRGDDAEPNVLVLRSMSKGYGLAGLRLGYGLASAELITVLQKVRDSYNVDAIAQAVGTAALNDVAYARTVWQKVVAERERVARALRDLGFAVPDSASNFVLARCPEDAPTAGDLYRSLKQRGLLVRHFETPGLDDRLRITIGSPDQNTRLLDELADLLNPAASPAGDAA
ncbi:MAG: histidinol-phosphate transaminase [Planctomycetota bacterium]